MLRNLALLAILSLSLGCSCPSASAWKAAWGDIRGPYLQYVEGDSALSDEDKALRRQHVLLLDKVLEKTR